MFDGEGDDEPDFFWERFFGFDVNGIDDLAGCGALGGPDLDGVRGVTGEFFVEPVEGVLAFGVCCLGCFIDDVIEVHRCDFLTEYSMA